MDYQETTIPDTIQLMNNKKVENELGLSNNKFPVGYRFKPTDQELIINYLMEKIHNNPIPIAEMTENNVYSDSPMNLAAKHPSFEEKEWYFFTPRERKYPNGDRPNRAAGKGFWKATGADKLIIDYDGEKIGYRKALVYYQGKPKAGLSKKTNWHMHEFRADIAHRSKAGPSDMRLDDWVLCRIFQKLEKEKKDKLVTPSQPVVHVEVESAVTPEYAVEQSHDTDGEINNNNSGGFVTPRDRNIAPAISPHHLMKGNEQSHVDYGAVNNNYSEAYVTHTYQNIAPAITPHHLNIEGNEQYHVDHGAVNNSYSEDYATQMYQYIAPATNLDHLMEGSSFVAINCIKTYEISNIVDHFHNSFPGYGGPSLTSQHDHDSPSMQDYASSSIQDDSTMDFCNYFIWNDNLGSLDLSNHDAGSTIVGSTNDDVVVQKRGSGDHDYQENIPKRKRM